ncbi:MAG: hypothetical protein AAGG02_03060 [Cyanobacteria bacterium P01_H01_bin.15]
MKKLFLLLASAALLTPQAAIAKTYEADCFHLGEQKFKSCDLTIDNKGLTTAYNSEKYQNENGLVPVNSITGVASGNYARRILTDSGSIAAGILLAPLALANSIFKSEAQEYIIRTNAAADADKVKIYRLKPKDAPEFQQELTQVTKKWIVFEAPNDNTLIDVGPDIKVPDVEVDL